MLAEKYIHNRRCCHAENSTHNNDLDVTYSCKLSELKSMRFSIFQVIVNTKHLDSGYNVIQLETAVGAAMKCFNGCIGVNVPRSRFLPVKKTSDLMLVMSNLYSLRAGSLVMSPQRMFPSTPLVKLGDNHFSKVRPNTPN